MARKKNRTFTKVSVILLIVLLFILFGIYFGGAFYFKSHFFPNTSIGDIECSRQTSSYIELINIDAGEEYLLTLYDRNGDKYHLAGMDFGYEYVAAGEEAKILDSQNTFAWPQEISRSHSYLLETSYTYDEQLLQQQILALDFLNKEEYESPTDAYLQLNENGTYEIIPETLGNTPIPDQVVAEITAAVQNGLTEYTLSDACYEMPKVTAEDPVLTEAMAKIDDYCNAVIHYEIADADENLTSDQIAAMLVVGDDYSVSVDSAKLEQFVQHLASTYNTYGDKRSFTTSLGDVVEIGGGDYGWVVAKTKEAAQILEDLEGGVPVSREPIWEQTALQSGLNDIGNTYVEIDYTNQHLYYYKDGVLQMDSDIVSGKISNGNGSPDGVFKIVYKQSPATLVGETYESDVDYFMPFAYNVGIHDASWRNKFGGSIYKSSGSHGCINVPGEFAKALYAVLEVGTPVIAYYRESVKLTSTSSGISNAYSYVKTN